MTLVVKNLRFRYPRTGFELHVEELECRRGEVTALIGPNGAGKTTFLHMLADLLVPEDGRVWFDGRPISALIATGRLGLCLDSFPPESRMTVGSWLGGLSALRAVDGQPKPAPTAVRALGIEESFPRRLGTLSLGQGRRAALAMAIGEEPECVLLDEPVAGLDPEGIVALRGLLEELRQRKAVVLISSHLLGELEKIADRYLFFLRGRLVRVVDRAELQQDGVLRVRVSRWPEAARKRWPDVGIERPADDPDAVVVRLRLGASDATERIVEQLVNLGVGVHEAVRERRALQEIYDELVSSN